jgi:hypothetical protein
MNCSYSHFLWTVPTHMSYEPFLLTFFMNCPYSYIFSIRTASKYAFIDFWKENTILYQLTDYLCFWSMLGFPMYGCNCYRWHLLLLLMMCRGRGDILVLLCLRRAGIDNRWSWSGSLVLIRLTDELTSRCRCCHLVRIWLLFLWCILGKLG